jgi:hypothetical protein
LGDAGRSGIRFDNGLFKPVVQEIEGRRFRNNKKLVVTISVCVDQKVTNGRSSI